mmetsp:Transcript_10577/g.21497  ORF Transcript_10577/g.21497 Transcript_10577/m.21497 type:complete len:92 (-) Transcript_10577:1066-1341(-)
MYTVYPTTSLKVTPPEARYNRSLLRHSHNTPSSLPGDQPCLKRPLGGTSPSSLVAFRPLLVVLRSRLGELVVALHGSMLDQVDTTVGDAGT